MAKQTKNVIQVTKDNIQKFIKTHKTKSTKLLIGVIIVLLVILLASCTSVKQETEVHTVIQDVSVIKSAKACTNEGSCRQ